MTAQSLASRALATTALAPVLAALLGGAATAAAVLPTGGKVAAGQAVIGARSGSSLSVTQSSSKAVIDWTGFSIGSGGSVNFANSHGATLNRVTGSSASALDGLLTATGSVFLINPNGVVIGKDGVVQTGGSFLASTQNLTDAAFLKGGDLTFTGASSAAIVNEGKVGSLGGDVALIAASVTNSGAITAANGTAGLVSGYSVLMRDAALDSGEFSVLLGGATTSVTNSGTIAAADAELRAEGGSVYALAGDTAGTIRATGVKSGQGKVWLVADGGTLDVAGTIEAAGANGKAGAVETSGGAVTLGKADIDAHGGTWLVDPYDLTIDQTAANTINATLNRGGAVTETTSATGTTGISGPGDGTANPDGAGDIIVTGAISWSTTATLTLSAYRDIAMDGGSITVSGGGTLNLVTDNSGAGNGGALSFGRAGVGEIQFTGTSNGQPTGALTIGVGSAAPTTYTLVATLATLSADIAANNTGAYALATSVDGSNGGVGYTASPLVSTLSTPFAGVLEGLGNQIQTLTITDPSNSDVGLFGQIGAGGVVRDIFVNSGVVAGTSSNRQQFLGALAGSNAGLITGASSTSLTLSSAIIATLGGLVGANSGTITDSYAADTVSEAAESTVGGLAGLNTGSINQSYTTGALSGAFFTVGGLVGDNSGGILDHDYATGSVTNTQGAAGGLVGTNETPYESTAVGTITNSYATGAVEGGFVGGLVGQNDKGAIAASYATGAVLVGYDDASVAGGLVGDDTGGTITASYATGAVGVDAAHQTQYTAVNVGGLAGQSSGAITGSYATGDVTGPGAGGLVGANDGGSITDSYATGQVTGTAYEAGGLVALNYGAIANAYATGAVSGSAGSSVGGLVGYVEDGAYGDANPSSITNVYATGAVTGAGKGAVGGLVGTVDAYSSDAPITYAYATGLVKGGPGDVVGGFVGSNSGGFINDSLWDRTSTGQAAGIGSGTAFGLTSVQDTDPTAIDYAFSTVPYMAAGFSFGVARGGSGTWVVIDTDGSLNNTAGAAGGTRPMLLEEYSQTIVNAHQLQLMELDPTASYTLANDIDATATAGGDVWAAGGFVPVGGNAAAAFSGVFEGASHGVTGLTIARGGDSSSTVGLFGQSSGTIQDVGLTGGSVGGGAYVGALVGLSFGVISNAYSTASVSGEIAGGLAGALKGEGSVTGSYAAGAVTGVSAGGLVGSIFGADASIADAYATGAVTLTADGIRAGGLVGLNEGVISQSYALGDVDASAAQAASAGGLVGDNYAYAAGGGMITTGYATGNVHGGAGAEAGGLVGVNGADSTISQSYATGNVLSDGGVTFDSNPTPGQAGGLVGVNYGAITNAYAIGSTGQGAPSATLGYLVDQGGFAGDNEGSISSAWASGAVGAGYYSGGFAAVNNGTISAAYYDQGTTGLSIGAGRGDNSGIGAVGGNTGLSPYSVSSYPNLEAQFGTTPGGSASETWVIVDSDSTLNNAGGVGGGTRPFLLSEYSLSVGNAHQLELLNLTPYPIGFGLVYTQTADIDLAATRASIDAPSSDMWAAAGFVPIGQGINSRFVPVSGGSLVVDDGFFNAYDGKGYTIANLYINDLTDPDVGLFGEAEGGTGGLFQPGATIPVPSHSGLSNINLVNATVTGTREVGAVAGYADSIDGASVTGVVTALPLQGVGAFVGGIAGNGAVSGGVSAATVSGGDNSEVGGVVGSSEAVTSSQAMGFVSGGANAEVGGVVGEFFGYVIANVSSARVSGGAGASVGGLAGWDNDGFTLSNYATGAVTGGAGSMIGGLFGRVLSGAMEINNYATGAVTATGGGAKAGGYAGQIDSGATIQDAYAIGAVTGGGSDGAGTLGVAAGFAGSNAGTVSAVWASGKVTGGGDGLNTLAGLVGSNTGSVSEGFWDVQTTGQLLDPAVSLNSANGSTGLTTAQFMDPTSPISGLGLAATSVGLTRGFVIVDVNGTYNGAGGAAGATRPFLLNEAFAGTAITNLHQLQLIGVNPYELTSGSFTFTLANDIDASPTADANPSDMWGGAGFVPIGPAGDGFTGTFDGANHTISGLTIAASGDRAGLFGVVDTGAVVENLTLSGARVLGGNIVGVVAGVNAGLISNVAASDLTVSGTDFAGGLVGYNTGLVVKAAATGAVTGSDIVGGVVGSNDSGGVITGANASDSVSAAGTDGQGYSASWVGGLVGYSNGVIADSSATGAVNGAILVGGLVGSANTASNLSVSYATGAAVGSTRVAGGLAGYNAGTIANVYATGAVSAPDYTGGLLGYNDTTGAVNATYSAGSVTGSAGAANVGGFVGYDAGAITNGYFDADATGAAPGAGAGPSAASDDTASSGAVAADGFLVGRDPTAASNYGGFDPNIWTFDAGSGLPTLTADPQAPAPSAP